MNAAANNYQVVIPTPFGAIGIKTNGCMVSRIDLMPTSMSMMKGGDPFSCGVGDAITQYLKHSSSVLDFPIHPAGTVFQQRVWTVIREIPVGQTLTYAQLAKQVESSPRAVANACGANPYPLIIPCHRVVGRDGLGGFMQGRRPAALSIKAWLLRHEGIVTTA